MHTVPFLGARDQTCLVFMQAYPLLGLLKFAHKRQDLRDTLHSTGFHRPKTLVGKCAYEMQHDDTITPKASEF